jgi:SAM-dependent methyltransferase
MEVVAPHFFEVVGVDISEKMAAVAKTRVAKASFHIGDLTAEDAALGQFDLITAFRFFGNAEDALRQQVLRILRAKIRSDGWLIINNHRNPSAIRCKLSGETAGMDLTHKKLTRFLADAGFRVEKAIPIGLWMLRHRWSDRRYWNGPAGSLADRLTAIPWLVPWSPDAVIAARPMPAS